ncbi:hypothetical protein R3X27_03560 [Tropicimonas sp. TH_r6]|uniref:hypothetical protein n=1 Tax=Tropicimonas sp. TH_r6 TaxID=3082085 RepID=UPI0029536E94|nr:hypothetical protein [Tropicimonas sp. TH_r6]MDV7141753.1 hypothetical protein [Tropicimonas sp. TH_r6]
MQIQQHDNDRIAQVVSRAVRASETLTEELGDARPLFDFGHHRLIDTVSRGLEKPEFLSRDTDAQLEILQDIVANELLQEVLSVTTTLEEVYADAGLIEYEIRSKPEYSAKGERFKRLEDALVEFRQSRREMVVMQKVELFFEQHGRH